MNNIDKLDHRIERDFKKCTYIGDIAINDEEYDILKGFLRLVYDRICNSTSHETVDPLFAVALVQIGIRYYDGRFWSYVQKELGLEKLPQNHQNWIGTSFYKTLLQYNKFHVDKSEFMNNILLHCFITKHYANDLFDFLFAYYKIDLDRDLTRNNSDMRNYLMQSMSKGEQTARAYKIKKHTADAVSANAKGSKIRVGRILRFMDNALFKDLYPINSQNRIAQLFCEWAKTSDAFDAEKKRTRGLTHSGEKRFSTPYIHFDTNKECFRLLFPQQYIHLEDDEEMPVIVWKIKNGADTQEIPARTDVCVTGCKTEKSETVVLSEMLLNEFEIEIWKNGTERIRRFRIRSDSVRFFDSDWDMIDSETYSRYLPVGDAFAFCDPDGILLSDSDSVLDCEKKFGYNLYTLSLKKGDILRLPNGKAKSVGKPLEEGILSQNLVSGVYAIDAEKKYQIYNSVPSVYFRMIPRQENGTLIVVNGERYRFDVEKCVRFDVDEETEEKGYILKLGGLINTNGIYDIIIDVPNSRRERYYSFAFLSGFSYQYENAPYIFQKRGKITFSDTSSGIRTDNLNSENPLQFDFDILPDQDYLSFNYDTATKTILLQIFIPVLKWKFDDGLWNIGHPEEIWHKEFPKMIYIKYPDDEITFSMSPTMLETSEEDDENNTFSAPFRKNKEKNIFECDTRKMISWFGYEDIRRTLYLKLNGAEIRFVDVLLKYYIESCNIVHDKFTRIDHVELTVFSRENTYVDIYQEEKLVVKKSMVEHEKKYKILSDNKIRKYDVYLYTKDNDDFGNDEETFELCDKKEFINNHLGDLTQKAIRIISAFPPEMKNQAVTFFGEYYIKNISQKSINEYEGVLFSRKINYRLKEIANVNITFLSEDCIKLFAKEGQYTFYYGYITQSLYLMDAQMLIRSANKNEYTCFNEFVYQVEITEEANKVSPTNPIGISKKYNWPIDKTPLKKSIITKLRNADLLSTDQIVDYGLDRLCTVPKVRKKDAIEIINVLVKLGYKFSSIDQILHHYAEEEER